MKHLNEEVNKKRCLCNKITPFRSEQPGNIKYLKDAIIMLARKQVVCRTTKNCFVFATWNIVRRVIKQNEVTD